MAQHCSRRLGQDSEQSRQNLCPQESHPREGERDNKQLSKICSMLGCDKHYGKKIN